MIACMLTGRGGHTIMPRPKLPKQDKGVSKSICLKPAEWKILKRGSKSFAAGIRKLIPTMSDRYADGSSDEHIMCPDCNMCIKCGDCAKHGCKGE